MWIMTKHGFFSIVQHNTDSDAFLVRARDKQDLVRMFDGCLVEGGDYNAPLIDQIFEDPKADYRWRLVVSHDMVKDLMDEALDDIDYTSHAKEAMAEGKPGRHKIYMDVWADLMKIQNPTPVIGRPAFEDADPNDFMVDGDVYCYECGDDLVLSDGKWQHLWTITDPLEAHEAQPATGDGDLLADRKEEEQEKIAPVIDMTAALAATQSSMKESDD